MTIVPSLESAIHASNRHTRPKPLTPFSSTIRQVPDNQEVYLSTSGFTSLTFDITERVAHLPTDTAALEYHFDDIVAEGDTKQILSISEKVELPHHLP